MVSITLHEMSKSIDKFLHFFIELLQLLNALDAYAQAQSKNRPIALNSVRACRTSLEKLISKMDDLEAGFDKIAERSRRPASLVSSVPAA